MFLTTIRVRRARRKTLAELLTARQLQSARDYDVELVEVLAHGQVVAIVAMEGDPATTLWRHPALVKAERKDNSRGYAEASFAHLADGAAALMGAVDDVGLTAPTSEAA